MADTRRKYCLYVREDLAALPEGFFEAETFYNMRSDLYMYRALRDFLKTQEIDLDTQRYHAPEESEVILCLNETDFFTTYQRTSRNRLLVLLLTEPPIYNAKDWSEARHQLFDKVFTYNSDLIQKNNHKYIHLTYPIDLSMERLPMPGSQEIATRQHSCMIAGAFAITPSKTQPDALLYARYQVLRWYHRHAPGQLDYYGRTSPEQKFMHFRGAGVLSKIYPALTTRIGTYLYKKNMQGMYKGAVGGLDKNKTLARYRFNFCFENSANLKGYITEKLFDGFFSRCVPVYKGAPDIEQYVPKNCYIAFSDFDSLDALQKYLSTMDETRYLDYLQAADNFLNSPAVKVFSVDKFVSTVWDHLRS